MRLINKRNIKDALKIIGVMWVINLLCLFVGSGAAAGEGVFNWILFFGFMFIYFIAAYMDGSIRGESECRHGDRLLNQVKKTGIPLDSDEQSRLFNVKKGLVVTAMAALPGVILLLMSAVTADEVIAIRAVTRVYFTPYLKLFSVDMELWKVLLIYLAGAFVYPLLYFVGYLNGPKQHAKVKETIRKNEEDYKKGIRRRRPKPKKRKRGWF